jgi:hypothetical protein
VFRIKRPFFCGNAALKIVTTVPEVPTRKEDDY